MKWHKNLITIVICITILAIFPIALGAQVASVVDVRIKISVCGNGIKEGGEECDQSDLDNDNCSTQGYSSGTLACDYSCFFDYDGCISATPTPIPASTPLPTASPTSTATVTSIPTPSSTSIPTPIDTPTATATLKATSTASTNPSSSMTAPSPYINEKETNVGKTASIAKLPLYLRLFDIDNSGIIEKKEIYESVKEWVNEWKKQERDKYNLSNYEQTYQCDLNNDGFCTILDFSLLMYNIQ